MKWLLRLVLCLLLMPLAANADTIFNINGATPQPGLFTGTLTIDTINGLITESDVFYSSSLGNFEFTGAGSGQGQYSSIAYVDFISSTNNAYSLTVLINASTLIGYTGGDLCSQANLCFNTIGGFFVPGVAVDPFSTGTLALATDVTPEPGTFVLLGTGLLGIAAAARRRLLA